MDKESAAIKTLEHLGYTYNGGQLWKPPLGRAPSWAKEPTARRVSLIQYLFRRYLR